LVANERISTAAARTPRRRSPGPVGGEHRADL